MLDDLRNTIETGGEDTVPEDNLSSHYSRRERKHLLGMSAGQRFILAMFLFLLVAILGIFLLIAAEEIFPPI